MRLLKKKFRKKKKPVLKRIKITPKLGQWCDCYSGRLPFPIECQANKAQPLCYTYKGDEKKLVYDRSVSVNCNRNVDFISWKRGDWKKIIKAIANKEDLRDMDPFFKKELT